MTIEHSLRLTECSALSICWMFGLYEALRTLRQQGPLTFAPLAPVFRELEIVRMPLAKHQVKGVPGYRDVEHYPTSVWDPVRGHVGWHTFDPYAGKMATVVRTELADRFLAVVPGAAQ